MKLLNFPREPINRNYHDKAVKDIAKKRFDEIKYDVYTNPGKEKNAHVGAEDNPLYPDIVVLEKGVDRRKAIAIGEIETADTITENEAGQWKDYSNTKIPFYLYVPTGYDRETIDILKKGDIVISGLRTYKYAKSGEIIITDIF